MDLRETQHKLDNLVRLIFETIPLAERRKRNFVYNRLEAAMRAIMLIEDGELPHQEDRVAARAIIGALSRLIREIETEDRVPNDAPKRIAEIKNDLNGLATTLVRRIRSAAQVTSTSS